MSEDHLTTEERDAMTAMEADTASVADEEQAASAETPAEDPAPEFKSTRAAPEWDKLSDEQREGVARFLDGKPPPGLVPHQSMHAERMKRQELERRLAEIEAAKTPAEAPPEWKDPIEDPEGHRKWEEYGLNKAREDAIAEFRKQQTQDAERQERVMRADQAETEFTRTQPDYPQATDYLARARASQLYQMGYGENEIMAQLRTEANLVYDSAVAAGVNPAALIYIKAQQFGYKPTQAAPAQQPTDAQRIAHFADTQQRTRGAGNAGGSAQQGELTMAQLADMSESELMKLPADVRRKAMGG